MADVDDDVGSQDGNQQYEEEDVWEDPVEDVEALEDGPRTIIVGGASRIDSIDDALERYRGPGDRIIVMPGIYETGMILDSGKFPRLHIYGAFPPPTEAEEREARKKQKDLEERAEEIAEEEAMNRWLPPPVFGPERAPVVIFKGKLNVQFSDATAVDYDEEEGEPLATGAVSRLTVSNITFQGGASISEEANIELNQCEFGIPFLPNGANNNNNNADGSNNDDTVREQRTVRVNALATPTFNRCRIFGAERSALYCYPYAKGVFKNCDIVGMVSPPSSNSADSAGSNKSSAKLHVRPAATSNKTSSSSSSINNNNNKPPVKCLSDAGIHLDDASCTFYQCSVRNFNLGVVTNDACEGTKFTECTTSEIATVGYFFGPSCKVNIRECKGKLCGREAVVLGPRSHVSMRDCLFSGDVRLKDEAVLTALVDNSVGPETSNWKIISEAKQFSDRGFKIVEDDPSARKKRKPPPVEE